MCEEHCAPPNRLSLENKRLEPKRSRGHFGVIRASGAFDADLSCSWVALGRPLGDPRGRQGGNSDLQKSRMLVLLKEFDGFFVDIELHMYFTMINRCRDPVLVNLGSIWDSKINTK